MFLRADLDEVCWTDRHLRYALGIGLPMLLVYVVGLPVAAWLRVRAMQRNLDVQGKTLGDVEDLGVFLEDRKLRVSGFGVLVFLHIVRQVCFLNNF